MGCRKNQTEKTNPADFPEKTAARHAKTTPNLSQGKNFF